MKKKFRDLSGVLLLDKSEDLTSNRALQDARFLFAAKKAGHTGTLDPFATGLLVVCFGEANKFSRWMLGSDKTYEFTIKLGTQTETADKDGEIIAKQAVPEFNESKLNSICGHFLGEITQIPPKYSALRVNGVRAYDLARQGKDVDLQSRQVTIHQLQLEKYGADKIKGIAKVSKGTYIRILAEDIAKAIGTVGHCLELRRLEVGNLLALNSPMYRYLDIQLYSEKDRDNLLLPMDVLCQQFSDCSIDQQTWTLLSMGRKVDDIGPDISLQRTYLEGNFIGLTSRQNNQRIAFRLINTNR